MHWILQKNEAGAYCVVFPQMSDFILELRPSDKLNLVVLMFAIV